MELAIALLLLWPAVSIGVRRLHDVGLSGAWLLLALPATIVILWTDWLVVRDGLPPRQRPELVNGPLLWIEQSCYLAVFVMLLWKDDPEPNHYGPNPRYDAPDQGPRNPPPAPDVVAS
jgi:uncharacterized membrane protein YhaH (DUF805 family)